MEHLGQRIKKIRKAIGLTQKDFSEKLGVYPSHVSKIESGRAKPSTQLINLICATFAVNEKWLRVGKGGPFEVEMNDENFLMLLNRLMSGDFSYEQKKALYLAARLRVMGQRTELDRDRKMEVETGEDHD